MLIIVKSLMILTLTIVMSGCATNSDIEKLQSQLDSVSNRIDAANLAVNDAKFAANEAQVKANNAEQAANRAAKYCADINEKLDRLFKKQQHK